MSSAVSTTSRKILGSIILPSAGIILTSNNNHEATSGGNGSISPGSTKHVSFCEAVKDDEKRGNVIYDKKRVILQKRVSSICSRPCELKSM